MSARGIIHNPGIFNEIKEYIKESKFKETNELSLLENDYEEICQEKEDKNNKYNVYNEENIKESKNLAKIFDTKYKNKEIDILKFVREFTKLAYKYENAYQNTKYNSSYILKTHKKHLNLFNKIQQSKNYDELFKILEIS